MRPMMHEALCLFASEPCAFVRPSCPVPGSSCLYSSGLRFLPSHAPSPRVCAVSSMEVPFLERFCRGLVSHHDATQGLPGKESLSLLLCGQQARPWQLLLSGEAADESKSCQSPPFRVLPDHLRGRLPQGLLCCLCWRYCFHFQAPDLTGRGRSPPVPSCARRMQARAGFQTQLLSAPRCLISKAPANKGDT